MKLTNLARIIFAPPVAPPRRISQWLRAPTSLLPFQMRQAVWQPGLVDRIFTDLHQSPSFAAMIDEVPELEDVPVHFLPLKGPHAGSDGLYSPGDDAILVNYKPQRGDYFKPLRYRWLNTFAHEYRHAFQHKHPQGRYNQTVSTMSRRIMEGFLVESDACAFNATVAWELRQKGVSANYWRNFAIHYPDIAEAFVTAIRADQNSLHDGRAQTAAVLAWFDSATRVNTYAADYIRHIREYMAMPPQERAHINPAATMPPGKAPLPVLPPEGAQQPPDPTAAERAAHEGKKTTPPRFFAYRDAGGVLHERDRYMDADSLPTGMDFYCRNLTAARWREVEKLDRELQLYLARYHAAKAAPEPKI